jgi:hypothetical protein
MKAELIKMLVSAMSEKDSGQLAWVLDQMVAEGMITHQDGLDIIINTDL